VPWFKVDDAFHGHPKVMELSPAAVGVWTLAGSWCANYLTDGEIKTGVVRRFGADDAMIQELVNAGLWIDLGGAYQFKDWDEYQPLKEEVEAERNAARERMKAVRAKKKGVERSPEQPANVQPNNTGTFGGTSEEVRVTPSLSLSLPIPVPKVPAAPRKKPAHTLPGSWSPNEAHTQYAEAEGIALDFQAERFRTHAEANDRRIVNWDAAFKNWLLKAERTVKTKPTANRPWSKEIYQ
jgi:hypothetical protein